MHFVTLIAGAVLTAAAATEAAADIAPVEIFTISQFAYKQETGGKVTEISFYGSGPESDGPVYCDQENPKWPDPAEPSKCDHGADYSFALHPAGMSTVRLRIYHQASLGNGRWGEITIPVTCSGSTCLNGATINMVLSTGEPADFP